MWIFQQQQHLNYQQIERLSLPLRRAANLPDWFWQSFLGFWHKLPGEPRVQQKSDRAGNLYWHVYDPVHDNTMRFDDQQQLLVWLDEQHYRRARPNPWDIQ
jgi:hypothetical protein